MTNKQLKLVEKCSKLEPLEGRILVAPNKVRTYKDKTLTGKPVDENIKPEDITHETEMIMEEVETDVNYKYQTAVVLQVSADETRFKVGDTVIYNIGALIEFDYIKGVSELRKYDVHYVVKTT